MRPTASRSIRMMLAAATCALVGLPSDGWAQFDVRDLVISAGASAEGYQGNLPSVGVPVRDSTEFASAAIGEVSVRTDVTYGLDRWGRVDLTFDGGLRQLSARGFQLRDYAPREWSGTLNASWAVPIGGRAAVTLRTQLRGREVNDRPPMPIFLQPGYQSGFGAVRVDIRGPRDVIYDLEVSGEKSDFSAPGFAPQIRLLNRSAQGVEAGATLGGADSSVRIFGGLHRTGYPKQDTFDPTDSTRRDLTFRGGASWSHQADYLVQVELDGRANRSNSNRPEYDALTIRAAFSASLPRQVAFGAYGAFTAKQYLHPSEFARLLPGEEANSASLAYLSVTRAIAQNLDGTIRAGWTRAETEIGDAYFQRFGGSFFLHFRPNL